MSVFLLPRTFERGNLHSTGMSRFIATPVPVPLQRPHLNHSCYVAHSYSGTAAQEGLCTPGLLHSCCSTRCCLRPRRPVFRSPLSRLHVLLAGRSKRSAFLKLTRSRGYVSDSGHPPFTSSNSHRSTFFGSGRLDLPYPGRLLLCSFHSHILSFSTVAQSLVT